MKPIIIVPSGLLTHNEISEIKEGGYIVLVSDDPDKIKIVDKNESNETTGLTKDKLLKALMRVVYNSKSTDADYMREWLCRILMNNMGAIKDK